MANSYQLLEANPSLELKDSVYQNVETFFRESELDHNLQVSIQEVFDKVDDKSLFSFAIESELQTDQLRQSLSTHQFRYLSALNFSSIDTALDLTQDFGGVSHYLADKVASLDSVKFDLNKSRFAVQRCASHSNILHVSEDLDRLAFPQANYDLIVIGEAESLELDQTQFVALIAKLQTCLSASGVLLIDVVNENRLNRWFDEGSAFDSSSTPYLDLYHSEESSLFFSRSVLRSGLLNSGFSKIEFHANFSADKECRALFCEDYLTANPNAKNHFHRLGFIKNSQINEYLLFDNLVTNKQNLNDYAGRYVVFAGADRQNIRAIYDNDFTHFPGGGRRPGWRTLTFRHRSATEIVKESVFADIEPDNSPFSQNLDPQKFAKGRLLVHDWLLAIKNLDSKAFRNLVVEYSDWLDSLNTSTEDFARIAYDALPFNVIVQAKNQQQEFHLIDPEWQYDGELTKEFILFRALFWFAHENRSLIKRYCDEYELYSIGLFILDNMKSVGAVNDLADFVHLEESLQEHINQNSMPRTVANAVVQGLDENFPVLEVSWSNEQGQVPSLLANSQVWNRHSGKQKLVIPVPANNSEPSHLRIDPMADLGGLQLSSIELRSESGPCLWQASTADEVKKSVDLVGIVPIDESFVCISDDPYFLIDMSQIQPESAGALELHIEIAHKALHNLEKTISVLSLESLKQTAALTSQANRNNEYRSEIEHLQTVVDGLRQDRMNLKGDINRIHSRVNDKQRQINYLIQRLKDQYNLNENLYHHLTNRPTTRAKGILRRLKNKVLRRPAVELPTATEFLLQTPKPETFEIPELVRHFPLPKGDLLGQNNEDYGQWVRENSLSAKQIENARHEIEQFSHKPVFSILVPIYNTDPEYLLPMIESVKAQIYPHWQLCLVDDCSPKSYLQQILQHEALQDERISIQLNDVNQGISVTTNDALAMANGDYIALLDHDDEISIDALYENAKVINEFPEVGLIYSDEDKIDMQGNRLEPFFKPDYSPDFLSTNNYICHFSVIRKSLADEIGGFREGLDGSQDHDIILRAAHNSKRVVHIPKILYHWRKIPGSTAVVYDAKSYAWEAGRRAVEDQLRKNEGDDLKVELGTLKGTYTVVRDIRSEPLVSIVIPFKDKPELLDTCLSSIIDRSSYTKFEIIGVSNNSEQDETHQRMKAWSEHDQRIRFIEHNIPFNFSALCNFGAEQATGDYLLLLNNDIEVINADWLERLLEHAQRDEIGAVGGKLLYPNGRIQHAGIVVGLVGAAGHPHKFFPDDHIGYHGRLHMVHNVSAVTGAMLMVKTDKFAKVGGLDETNLAVAYNDVDFCLKLLEQGYYNVFTPYARATHHESISRGYEDTDEKMQRLLKEQDYFLNRWQDFVAQGDPYYNPNLSLKNEYFSLRFQD